MVAPKGARHKGTVAKVTRGIGTESVRDEDEDTSTVRKLKTPALEVAFYKKVSS